MVGFRYFTHPFKLVDPADAFKSGRISRFKKDLRSGFIYLGNVR